MSQEPIETHEMFKNIGGDDWKKWKIWKNDKNDPELVDWIPAGSMAKLIAFYERGVTDYLVPRAVVRVGRNEGGLPNLGRLGKITSPAGAPSLPGGSNWLLVGVSGSLGDDGKWFNIYEYLSSGASGWDREIYG